MYKNLQNIHIGTLIRERIMLNGMSYAEFARRLCVERTTVYSIVRSKSIDIDRLIRIGEILDYDFIRNVYQQPSLTTAGSLKIEINGERVGVASLDSDVHITLRQV